MAKRIVTPEEYKAKLDRKAAKRKRFYESFLKTLAMCLAIGLTYSAVTIAYTRLGALEPIQVNGSSSGLKDGFDDGDGNATSDSNQQDGDKDALAANFDLFVKSFNGVKTNAKSATLDKKSAFNYNSHIKANTLIETVAAPLLSSLLKEEEVGETYTGSDIMAQFPPSGETCNLKQSDIKKITCTEDGDYYIIEVVVKGSKNPKAGESVGAVASIITEQQIADPIKDIPLINGLKPTCDYHDTTVKAKIEKSTGNMVEYYFYLPMILIMADSSNSYEIGLGFEQWWRIDY